jgi:RNA polymerase sigma factor (sigma-70 family)
MTTRAKKGTKKKGRLEQKKKDQSPEAIKEREWRQQNLESDPYVAARRMKEEDPEALARSNELIKEHLYWAKDYANTYLPTSTITREEFHQAALLGMTEAARLFAPELGYSFTTHSTWYMRAAIQKLLSKNGRLMSRPRNWRASLQKLLNTMETMMHEGIFPDFDGACDRMRLRKSLRGALKDMYIMRSRELCPGHYAIMVADTMSPEDEVIRSEEHALLREAMKKLPSIYVSILIDSFNGMKWPEMEVKYGLSDHTLLRYKRRGIGWLQYLMGVGPKPDYEMVVKDPDDRRGYRVITNETGTQVPLVKGVG